MAVAKITPTGQFAWDDGKALHVVGLVSVAAGPDTYTAGGNPVNFLSDMVGDPFGVGNNGVGGVTQQPIAVIFNSSNGLNYYYDPVAMKFIIKGGASGAGAPASEITAGAVPAPVSSDKIGFYAIWKKFQ